MMTCEECGSINSVSRGLCFKCKIRTVGFAKGQLVNRLHPDLTMRESARKIVEDGEAAGLTPVPYKDVA